MYGSLPSFRSKVVCSTPDLCNIVDSSLEHHVTSEVRVFCAFEFYS
jgi:hypothetical protein